MQFRKRSFSLAVHNDFRSTIGFVLRPLHGHEAQRIELCPFQMAKSVIRVTHSHGQTLMESEQPKEDSPSCLEYTIEDLTAGVYYFEVNDGFYYQVKEVRVSAA